MQSTPNSHQHLAAKDGVISPRDKGVTGAGKGCLRDNHSLSKPLHIPLHWKLSPIDSIPICSSSSFGNEVKTYSDSQLTATLNSQHSADIGKWQNCDDRRSTVPVSADTRIIVKINSLCYWITVQMSHRLLDGHTLDIALYKSLVASLYILNYSIQCKHNNESNASTLLYSHPNKFLSHCFVCYMRVRITEAIYIHPYLRKDRHVSSDMCNHHHLPKCCQGKWHRSEQTASAMGSMSGLSLALLTTPQLILRRCPHDPKETVCCPSGPIKVVFEYLLKNVSVCFGVDC